MPVVCLRVRGLWNDDMKNMIIANRSVQNIPDDKAICKTVWEISRGRVLELAANCGALIYLSRSLNVHFQPPMNGKLLNMDCYGWKKGLKTGILYLRTCPAAWAIKFTVDSSYVKNAVKKLQVKAASAVTPVSDSIRRVDNAMRDSEGQTRDGEGEGARAPPIPQHRQRASASSGSSSPPLTRAAMGAPLDPLSATQHNGGKNRRLQS